MVYIDRKHLQIWRPFILSLYVINPLPLIPGTYSPTMHHIWLHNNVDGHWNVGHQARFNTNSHIVSCTVLMLLRDVYDGVYSVSLDYENIYAKLQVS